MVETTRGRWFLGEYARRNRYAETQRLVEILERLETKIDSPPQDPQLERVRMSILEMAQAIARTKDEIAAIKPTQQVEGRFGEATVELDAIVTTTETATDDILHAAEQIQEVAWTLRERGFDGPICDMLDERATDIYSACSFQDLTGQRTRKVINVLRYLEARINAMIDIWGVEGALPERAEAAAKAEAGDVPLGRKLAHGPAVPGSGLGQNAVDAMLEPAAAEGGFGASEFAALSIDDIMAAEIAEFQAVASNDHEAPAAAAPAAELEDAEFVAFEAAATVTEAAAVEAIDGEITNLEVANLATADNETGDVEAIDLDAIDLDAIDLGVDDLEVVDLEVIDLAEAEVEAVASQPATVADAAAADAAEQDEIGREIVDLDALAGDVVAAKPAVSGADNSFEIEIGGGAATVVATNDGVPQTEDAPSIASNLEVRIVDADIVDALEPDALDQLFAADAPEAASEAAAPHEATAETDALPELAFGQPSIAPALPPAESSAVRLSTSDIDQLTPAERTALFT
ncbi:Chemotaxis protein [Blastochloris viridis]|uniref:Chemotaxis protein n=1 Tax=Blastochloris viridis TaxID=1079 RepID=A0A182CZB8_BLAVI|nr:Chemotaxis protein [Blastochloris viridis]